MREKERVLLVSYDEILSRCESIDSLPPGAIQHFTGYRNVTSVSFTGPGLLFALSLSTTSDSSSRWNGVKVKIDGKTYNAFLFSIKDSIFYNAYSDGSLANAYGSFTGAASYTGSSPEIILADYPIRFDEQLVITANSSLEVSADVIVALD